MRAKLIYDLEITEDKEALSLALKAHDLFFVLWELDQILRGYEKHGHNFKDDAVEKIREDLHNIMNDKGVDFDMVC